MSEERRLGLDELMIVNPGLAAGEALLLGDDGTLYRVKGLVREEQGGRVSGDDLDGYFLGSDGTLYATEE